MTNPNPVIPGFKPLTLAELNRAPIPRVRYEDNGFTLCMDASDPFNATYWIEKRRINSPRKLVHWIRHLSEKSWVDADLIADLIDAVDKQCPAIGVWKVNP